MLTKQHVLAIKLLRECGYDEYEIVDNFMDEGVTIFLGEVRLVFADNKAA